MGVATLGAGVEVETEFDEFDEFWELSRIGLHWLSREGLNDLISMSGGTSKLPVLPFIAMLHVFI
jgi:hypothetical protein